MRKIFQLVHVLLLWWLIAVPGVSHAQHCDSIINHLSGPFYTVGEYVIQLEDGSLLCRAIVDSLTPWPSSMPVKPYGCKYYKITRHGATIVDSLFVEDDNVRSKLLAHLHPCSDTLLERTNVLVEYNMDTLNQRTDLSITFFDDNLNFSAEKLIVPLSDTIVATNGMNASFLLDSNNDIITEYNIWPRHESHFARIGLDGTIKCEKVYPDSIVPITSLMYWEPCGLRQISESPRKYAFYGRLEDEAFKCFELDSLFNILSVFNLPDRPKMFAPTGTCGMVNFGEEGVVVMQEQKKHSNQMGSIGVAQCDVNGNVLKTWFSPVLVSATGSYNYYYGIDLKNDHDGNLYFAAGTLWVACGQEICCIAKLDKDLNVIYERYYTHPVFSPEPFGMIVLDGGGMCLYGDMFERYSGNPYLSGLFMLVFDDDGVSVSETEGVVRPYCLFPNPVSDQLSIHFSPDVSPDQVELYDLQGRLLFTQRKNLESINMEGLPSGTYSLRVVMHDGNTYSEKVVKQ
ncbi:MAG: T9SS type A sorting domain-containing protein [Bacteroidales bacterium]|nr:T9SS type A sorting domain-containing protein [Bacteroidales bacterium]